MADFNRFFPKLLKNEGGFVNDPDDPGGATNKGITFQTFRGMASVFGLNPTIENLKNLTDEQAKTIYKNRYWDMVKGDWIQYQPLAEMICDFYVTSGYNAVIELQKVLRKCGAVLTVDGHFGEKTLKELNAVDNQEVYELYKQARIDFYRLISDKKPVLKKFLKGWINRVENLS